MHFTNQLKSRCRRYYGSAGPAFVTRLVGDNVNDSAELKSWLEKARQEYLARLRKEADGLRPLERASERFATVFAAGSLAIKYLILPWNRKKLLAGILNCQLDQLRNANAADPWAPSVATLRAKLVQYINENSKDFMLLTKQRPRLKRDDIDAVLGYRDKQKGKRWYYLTDTRLRQIIGDGANATELKRTLADEGLLAKTKERLVVQRRIFKGGKRNQNYAWVHAFKAKLRQETAAG